MTPDDDSPRAFELGLSLAGGVSCGAYTAGAIDFIVEALDAWQDARDRREVSAPNHRVVLRAVAGASSGALTAAVLGAALQHEIPPARFGASEDEAHSNPLFDSWVNMTGLEDLLGTGDASSSEGLRSILDPTRLDVVARKALEFGANVKMRRRRWLADPFRIHFTVMVPIY